MIAIDKGMVSTLVALYFIISVEDHLQKKTKQKLMGNLEDRGPMLSSSQPLQMEHANLTSSTSGMVTRTAKSSPTKRYLPLQTTPELYSTLAEAFVDKPLVYSPQKGMTFDPPTSPEYTPHIESLKAWGRMINTTAADGNCMFRLLGQKSITTG